MTAFVAIATATGLLVSTALLVAVVVFLWWLDRYDRETLVLVTNVFAWGAAVAPVMSDEYGFRVLTTIRIIPSRRLI